MANVEATFSLLALAGFSYKVITKSILFATSAGSQYRRARFGVAGDTLYFMRLVDTDRLQEMHWNINLWTNKEVLERLVCRNLQRCLGGWSDLFQYRPNGTTTARYVHCTLVS